MKLLLDENLPHDLRKLLGQHEVFTLAYAGCLGVENGKLLELAVSNGFDALITMDAGIEFERNVAGYPLEVVVMHAPSNAVEHVGPLVPNLLQTLKDAQPGRVCHVR